MEKYKATISGSTRAIFIIGGVLESNGHKIISTEVKNSCISEMVVEVYP